MVVACVLLMLSSVEFYDQLTLRTEKVYDVPANGSLPAKFVVCKLTVAENIPQDTLGLGGLPPQVSCS